MLTKENPWSSNFITANSIKIHYVTQGSGPLMLMLHGFPEFWYSWRHQIPEFAQDYKAVALDLRGYNESDKPEDKSAYVMSEFIKDIEGVIKELGYEKCVLVGHDWGGVIAWSFAYAHPEMVEKLIVMNIPHPAKFKEGLGTPEQLLRSWYMFFFQLPFLPELMLEFDDYQGIGSIFKSMVNKSAVTDADIEAYKDAVAKRGALTSMINYYRNIFSGFFNQQEWGILRIPTLMLWGEEDTALGKELTYGTEEYVENFQIRYIPNCGHSVQQEQPQLVNQYMREFLSNDNDLN
ncbi:MAG: alpha/beta hydrolase [Okeania sp. SIO1H6]|nr:MULTISPECIES: alpha/beta hydrolase [unclassified Okeania]NET17239.1 alpha/beta hydrolase [Okeania sp. SIO1H6]NEP71342.1 alpha/beta hydrolase [Okeania sp. SIO2G5]NEP91964.1 alpha/beta hydrolase [Okeania sp. SIO2F5]NEQ89441.1 alpha/beta hydrolase [Okeania sp. SIO2G4]NES75625.1 alpha/beta hydrolase [Okeania sp. SIO1H4]